MLEVEGEGLPAGQEEHALSPDLEYSPGLQQTEAPANELLPAKHPALMSALHRPLNHNQSPPTPPPPPRAAAHAGTGPCRSPTNVLPCAQGAAGA